MLSRLTVAGALLKALHEQVGAAVFRLRNTQAAQERLDGHVWRLCQRLLDEGVSALLLHQAVDSSVWARAKTGLALGVQHRIRYHAKREEERGVPSEVDVVVLQAVQVLCNQANQHLRVFLQAAQGQVDDAKGVYRREADGLEGAGVLQGEARRWLRPDWETALPGETP